MSKKIKTVQCPKCGSVKKEKIGEHYICSNCGTEYFLDNDDININYNHNYQDNPHSEFFDSASMTLKNLGLFFSILLGVGALIAIIYSLFFSEKIIDSSSIVENGVAWDRYEVELITNKEQKPLLYVMGKKKSYTDPDESLYGAFYDIENRKILSVEKIEGINTGMVSDIKIVAYENLGIFAVVQKQYLYRIDPDAMKTYKVDDSFYKDHPEFITGIAQIEFVSEGDGEGFKIMNNEGNTCFYYPHISKVYSKDDIYKAQTGYDNIPGNSPVSTFFIFTNKSVSFPRGSTPQLMKIQYSDFIGGPQGRVRFKWNSAGGAVPINKNTYRLQTWEDFTPGRKYFSTDSYFFDDNEVVYSDSARVLISYSVTAAAKAPMALQALHPETSTILWTLHFDTNEKKKVETVVKTSNGFAVTTGFDSYLLLSGKGEILSEHKYFLSKNN